MVDDLVGEAADAVTGVLTSTMEEWLTEIKANWPVESGRSLRAFAIEVTSTPTQIKIRLMNPVAYSGGIKQAKETPSNPAVRLIFDVASARADQMALEVADAIQRL